MAEIVKRVVYPRTVLVAADSLYLKILSDSDSIALLEDDDAMIIPFSLTPKVNERHVLAMREMLLETMQLSADTLLIKNPYEISHYELAEHAIESFAGAKYHALANTARLLGAKEIHFVEAKIVQNDAAWEAGAKLRIPAGGGEAQVNNEVTKKIEERLEGHMKFPGSEPSPEDALTYLKKRNLSRDQQLTDLVEMRSGTNLICDYRMTLSGTREAKASFTSALNLANSGPVKTLQVGGSFSKTAASINRIDITTQIVF